MSTVIPNFDNISLDDEDSGIQWIPGVGFRPLDMTEELPFFGQMNCDIIDTGTQCKQGECIFGKSSGKYDLTIIPPVYDLPIIPYAPAYNPLIYAGTYVSITPTWWDDPWDPPTWDCCIIATSTPNDPPITVTDVPSTVSLGNTGFFLLTALFAVTLIRRLI